MSVIIEHVRPVQKRVRRPVGQGHGWMKPAFAPGSAAIVTRSSIYASSHCAGGIQPQRSEYPSRSAITRQASAA